MSRSGFEPDPDARNAGARIPAANYPEGNHPDANDPILPADREDEPDGDEDPGRPRPRRTIVIALVLVVALALAATSLFWLVVSPAFRMSQTSSADVGDCLSYDPSGSSYQPADCSDVTAQFRLVGQATDREGCVDIPGATRAVSVGTGFSCVGEKSIDPATALNTVGRGDCVAVAAGHAQFADCEGGTLPVLAVVRDVPKSAGESANGLISMCQHAGARDVRQTYAWALGAADGAEPATWDRVLCLGAPS
jgi:hypothetical protein